MNLSVFIDPKTRNELASFCHRIYQDDGWALVIRSEDVDKLEMLDNNSVRVVKGPWEFRFPAHMLLMAKKFWKDKEA